MTFIRFMCFKVTEVRVFSERSGPSRTRETKPDGCDWSYSMSTVVGEEYAEVKKKSVVLMMRVSSLTPIAPPCSRALVLQPPHFLP